ncbi:profilin [Plakobranchus ocellatus]|uniref:Profilin n=1 Tax=Plakobranchus ocellatus TaxID=259542 RepID=A0AAV4A0B2_9GAST|nr:profilin [Plakobranchus ocellatus]
MSWSGYVDNLEKGKGQCKYAAILGCQNNVWGIWAESTDKSALAPTLDEMVKAANAVKGNDQSIMGTGLTIGGQKFTCLRLEPELLICQGKGDNKDFSLVFGAGTSTCLVGFNPSGEVKTTQVREAVEVMKDYLKNAGY